MAELEIHHEGEHHPDPVGQRIGALAAVLAVFLAIVTITSHRTHTAAIMEKSAANDQWSYYQATRVKFHNIELGENLLTVLNPPGERAANLADAYKTQKKEYEAKATKIQQEAQHDEALARTAEERALRYDIGEGLLEIGLVLTSLYFISKKMMFPVAGLTAGLCGIAVAAAGLFV